MNILITSVGRRSYMVKYFQEAIGSEGIVHASNNEYTYAMQLANKSVITPFIQDGSYIDFILNYSIKNNISAIISLFDIDLQILSKNKAIFEQNGIKVIVSDYEIVRMCNDKWHTYKYLKSIGVDTPETTLDIEDCKNKLTNDIMKYPIMIKPRWGMGSIGIFQADDTQELEILYKKTLKTIENSYLKYELLANSENSVVFQQKIEESEYGLDVLNDFDGNFLTCVPKKKIAMRAGETDSAEIIDDQNLTEIGQKISKNLHFIGNLDVDCLKTKTGYSVLELNCRFGGQYPFSHLAGTDFPKAIIQMIKGLRVDENLLRFKTGVIGYKDINLVILKK